VHNEHLYTKQVFYIREMMSLTIEHVNKVMA